MCLAWTVAAHQETAAPAAPQPPPEERGFSLLHYVFGFSFLFQLIAIVHCAKYGRNRFWIWLLLTAGCWPSWRT